MNSKLYQRIQTAQEEKRFYEAHQLYKTVYFRCSLRKNYTESLECLLKGVNFFLESHQWESGSDLACLYVDVLIKSNREITDANLRDLCKFVSAMPSTCVDRGKFISKCLSLFSKNEGILCAFNEFLGRQLFVEGALPQARSRIMLAGDGYKVGCFLIEMHQRYGLVSEIDLFVTQAVLQFLCVKKTSLAALTFHTYTRHHPRLEAGPPFIHFPLLNFVWLLMLAIERKHTYDIFAFLCAQYRPQLMRDPSYTEYIEKISQVYFGAQRQNDPFSGILSNLVRMLGDDGDLLDGNGAIGPGQSSSSSNAMHVDEVD
ncbi:golgi to er traffic protein 4 [Echinococcus multilocularis]|uniref:Golgi to er traffic protein 4 n=1 Tax=Echinococcus multilocularis TaxID=6211 RepID=A0A068Y8L4_ECHMU|nr:golgi to er traffic protein 4 [Echinococcus multilocularis]